LGAATSPVSSGCSRLRKSSTRRRLVVSASHFGLRRRVSRGRCVAPAAASPAVACARNAPSRRRSMRQRGGASDAVPTQTPRYTNMAHSVAAWPRRRTDAKPRSSSWQHRLHEQRGGTGTRGATARCTAHAARLRGGLVAHGGAQGFERRGLAGRGSLAQREVYSGVGSVSLRSMSSHTRRWLLACVLLVLLPRRGSGQETPIWMSLDSARDTPAQPDAETEVSCPCMIYEPPKTTG
jgi:hypothetical protein